MLMLAIIVISGVGALLATILIFAERVITNYGDVEIDINRGTRKFVVKGGSSLLQALNNQRIFIPSACGGRGTCAYCKIKVLEGAGQLLPTEEPYMDARERGDGIRLSCQVKIRTNIKIEIPASLFAIKEYVCTCETIIDYTNDMKQFNFKLREPPSLDYIPGQYIQLLAPEYEGSPGEVYRAYSMSSDPVDKTCIELIVRRVANGICTTYLFDHLKQGDSVRINGPYGKFYLRDTDAPIIFIAGGSGIAPIKCMLHHMKNTHNKRASIFFFGVRTTKDLFLVNEMKAFERDLGNFRFVPVVSEPEQGSGWTGATGRVTDVVAEFLKTMPDAQTCEGYLCGSPGMINSATTVLKQAGIPEKRHYYDAFT